MNTQKSLRSDRGWQPGETLSPRSYEQSRKNLVTTGSLRTSLNSRVQRQSRIAPLESQNRLYLPRSQNQQAVSSRVSANSYRISISNGDHSQSSFRRTLIRHGIVDRNKRPNIRRQTYGPNRIENTVFSERNHFPRHRYGKVQRPLHNIIIKTKSGRKIKISHSFKKTNIILNTKGQKHRNAVPNIYPEQTKTPVSGSVVKNILKHEKVAMVHLIDLNGSDRASDHATSQSATFIKSEMTSTRNTNLSNITQQSDKGLMSTRNPTRQTKSVVGQNSSLTSTHTESSETTNTVSVSVNTTASSNLIKNTNMHKTDGTYMSVFVTSNRLDLTKPRSLKNTAISNVSHKLSQGDTGILDDVSHDTGRPKAPAEDVDDVDTPDASDPTDE